ncbi:MAG: ASKHA domain-containing protein [Actinomycetia bacterium]|nr:ASKHA domain-containing protein [Actinomycetes bacterium]
MDKVSPTESGLLADALAAGGHHLPMPCRGRHSCGRCGVYLAGAAEPPDQVEAALLARAVHGRQELALPGYEFRLACLARISGEVTIMASSIEGVVVADTDLDLVTYDGRSPRRLGCAIDIGTTTVTVLLFRLGDRERLADVSALNHQVAHGADVLSRIDAASRVGVAALRALIVDQLDAMLAEALGRAGARPGDIERITVTGNTTMLHLLTGRPVASLGVFPFTPDTLFGHTIPAAELFAGLTDAELYLPPGISTYVGPDIVCGVLATRLGDQGRGELLVDVGTNGEMALAANGRLWCCSTAAGPAFEGAEISAGMPALPGAIDDVWAAAGRLEFSTIERKRPKGLCGTGLINAVDAFLDLGVVDETGAMDGESVAIGASGIAVTQADVRKLQLAKAAIAAGIDTMLAESGLDAADLVALQLAGGFGSYISPEQAGGIGLIPVDLVAKSEPAGNTALTGAVLLTLSRAARREAERRAAAAVEVQLATHPVFMTQYIEQMAFREEPDD